MSAADPHEQAAPRAAVPALAPGPADVGIVAALEIEVGYLLDRLRRVREYSGPGHRVLEGECEGKLVAVTLTGPGQAPARRGAQLLLDGHRPRWLVSAGFAGALDPELKRGALFLASEVCDPSGATWPVDLSNVPAFLNNCSRSGRLLTVDHIIRTAAEKAELRIRHNADAVDMETAAIARICQERSVRFLSLRAISDEAGADLPPEILSILGSTGGYRLGAAFGAIWRRPSSLKDLWALRNSAHEAADRLATALVHVLPQLP